MPEDAASTSQGVRCGDTIIGMALLASDGRVGTLVSVYVVFQIMQCGGIVACVTMLKFVMIDIEAYWNKVYE